MKRSPKSQIKKQGTHSKTQKSKQSMAESEAAEASEESEGSEAEAEEEPEEKTRFFLHFSSLHLFGG